jgi:hypothetical protein
MTRSSGVEAARANGSSCISSDELLQLIGRAIEPNRIEYSDRFGSINDREQQIILSLCSDARDET